MANDTHLYAPHSTVKSAGKKTMFSAKTTKLNLTADTLHLSFHSKRLTFVIQNPEWQPKEGAQLGFTCTGMIENLILHISALGFIEKSSDVSFKNLSCHSKKGIQLGLRCTGEIPGVYTRGEN